MVSEATRRMYESHGVPVKENKVKEGLKRLNEMAMLKIKEHQQENARRNKIYKSAYRKELDQDIKKKARADVKRRNKFLGW